MPFYWLRTLATYETRAFLSKASRESEKAWKSGHKRSFGTDRHLRGTSAREMFFFFFLDAL